MIQPGTEVFLGLDVQARQITVVRRIGHSLPRPAQRFTNKNLLAWVRKMILQGVEVHTCYEAGCFGYVLHRQLEAIGARNLVVAPESWNGALKTDKRDALQLCPHRHQWEAGNLHAFTSVRVPTVEEEARREAGRHRQLLLSERARLKKRGSSLLLLKGIKAGRAWWRPAAREALPPLLILSRIQIEVHNPRPGTDAFGFRMVVGEAWQSFV